MSLGGAAATTLGYSRRERCRLCDGRDIVTVLSLTPTPPANAFVSAGQLDRAQPVYPLDLWFCRHCSHLQLLDVVDPCELFEDYVYVSGTSKVFVEHFSRYADEVIEGFGLRGGDLVVEIGSNDGTLLGAFKARGMDVLGVDPAKALARQASADGIRTLPEFFTLATAERIKGERGPARCVAANNVMAHIDDLGSVLDGVECLLAPDGVFVFEVSYLLDVYEKTLFDTIYHEHLDYHSVKPLVGFFARHGLELVDAVRVPTHGGSLRGIAQKAGGRNSVRPGVRALIESEERIGLDQERLFQDFARRIDGLRQDLVSLVRRLKAEDQTIAGYGAPAKATTLLYHFGLGRDELDFIVDDSPLKQGLFTPGLHIPVLPSSALKTHKPDYLIILAWNFSEPIMANNAEFKETGGRFIVPVPELTIV
ncbi:MAG: class I SAM-dependent methyltransferase [Alphaproteobacteria bacterium]|jgi:SAM-dependent methyltransferase|nr:class I SAM-dependent methyltransferase [Alphaproteobacteria bacterium]